MSPPRHPLTCGNIPLTEIGARQHHQDVIMRMSRPIGATSDLDGPNPPDGQPVCTLDQTLPPPRHLSERGPQIAQSTVPDGQREHREPRRRILVQYLWQSSQHDSPRPQRPTPLTYGAVTIPTVWSCDPPAPKTDHVGTLAHALSSPPVSCREQRIRDLIRSPFSPIVTFPTRDFVPQQDTALLRRRNLCYTMRVCIRLAGVSTRHRHPEDTPAPFFCQLSSLPLFFLLSY